MSRVTGGELRAKEERTYMKPTADGHVLSGQHLLCSVHREKQHGCDCGCQERMEHVEFYYESDGKPERVCIVDTQCLQCV